MMAPLTEGLNINFSLVQGSSNATFSEGLKLQCFIDLLYFSCRKSQLTSSTKVSMLENWECGSVIID